MLFWWLIWGSVLSPFIDSLSLLLGGYVTSVSFYLPSLGKFNSQNSIYNFSLWKLRNLVYSCVMVSLCDFWRVLYATFLSIPVFRKEKLQSNFDYIAFPSSKWIPCCLKQNILIKDVKLLIYSAMILWLKLHSTRLQWKKIFLFLRKVKFQFGR